MTDDGSTAADSRRRGQGFPSLPLQESVDAVVTAGLNGRDHSQDAFATYLGHKTANSGAFRAKLASLRDFGLLMKRGEPDRVVLSELAQELALTAPDHLESKHLLLRAFESCRVFGVLHADSAKNVPTDLSRLRTQVLMRMGVATDQADRFVDSFVKSAMFAGVAEFDGTKVTLLPREAALSREGRREDESADIPPRGADLAREPSREIDPPASATATATMSIPVALRQEWPVDGGAIEFVIRTPKAMPPAIYGLMAKMAEIAGEMERLLGSEVTARATPSQESGSGEAETMRFDGN